MISKNLREDIVTWWKPHQIASARGNYYIVVSLDFVEISIGMSKKFTMYCQNKV
jgi:hypothetical protein